MNTSNKQLQLIITTPSASVTFRYGDSTEVTRLQITTAETIKYKGLAAKTFLSSVHFRQLTHIEWMLFRQMQGVAEMECYAPKNLEEIEKGRALLERLQTSFIHNLVDGDYSPAINAENQLAYEHRASALLAVAYTSSGPEAVTEFLEDYFELKENPYALNDQHSMENHNTLIATWLEANCGLFMDDLLDRKPIERVLNVEVTRL